MCWEDSKKISAHLRNSIQILPANGGPAIALTPLTFLPGTEILVFL